VDVKFYKNAGLARKQMRRADRSRSSRMRRVSHDCGDYRKITRNIAADAKYCRLVHIYRRRHDAVEPRDDCRIYASAPVPSCVRLHEYNILSLLDTSVDWKRYESAHHTCLLAAYQSGGNATRDTYKIIASLR